MTNQLFYWQGIVGDPHIFEDYKTKINALFSGNYAEVNLDLKKLAGHRVYSVRLNKADRLLFTTLHISGKRHLLLLEIILNHDYQKSTFLKSGVLKNHLEKNVEAIKNQIDVNYFHPQDPLDLPKLEITEQIEPSYKAVEYHKNKFIILNDSQQDILQHLSTTQQMLISGPPGSGKSSVALSLLSHYIDQQKNQKIDLNNKKILYLTQSFKLFYAMQKMWQDLPQSQGLAADTVQFKTYKMIANTFPDMVGKTSVNENNQLDDFSNWITTYIHKYQILLKAQQKSKGKKKSTNQSIPVIEDNQFLSKDNYERIYQAFRILSFKIEGEGNKSLPFTNIEQLAWTEKAFSAYLIYLKENEKVDLSFFAPDVEPIYDLVFVDEAQDLSRLQLIFPSKIAKNKKIYYALDSHQSLSDAKSVRPFLKQIFPHLLHVELPSAYRCPDSVIKIVNEVIKIKHRVAGGIADKDAYVQVKQGEQITQNTGQIIWIGSKTPADHLIEIKKRAALPDFAIVTHPQLIEEAAKCFPETSVILSIQDSKGLEYNTVLAYRLLDDPRFNKANIAYQEAPLEEKIHRAKMSNGNETLTPLFNQLLTAFTRTTENLIIYQDHHRPVKALTTLLHSATDTKTTDLELNTEINWTTEISKLIDNDNIKAANKIINEKLNGNIDEKIQAMLDDYAKKKSLETIVASPQKIITSSSRVTKKNQVNAIKHQPSISSPTPDKKDKDKDKDKSTEIELASSDICLNEKADNEGNTLLHLATCQGQTEEVTLLIKKKMDINKKNNAGDTPLQAAMKKLKQSSFEISESLQTKIKAAIRELITAQEKQKEIFKEAIIKNNNNEVTALLEQNPNLANELYIDNNITSLHIAVRYKNLNIIKTLIQKGADVNFRINGITILHGAALIGCAKTATILIQAGATINQVTESGITALHIASELGHDTFVNTLIQAKANVNQACNNGITALYLAVKGRHVKIVQALLQAGAEVHQTDKDGLTALHVAAQIGDVKIINLLIQAGANVNQTSKNGLAALYIAIEYAQIEAVKILINAGTDVNIFSKEDITVLMLAIMNEQVEIIKLLITAKADVNLAIINNFTPLYIATIAGQLKIVNILLAAGADINISGKEGITPFHFAAKLGYVEIVNAFITAGAKSDLKDKDGLTPLDYAREENQLKIVQILKKAQRAEVNYNQKNKPIKDTVTNIGLFAVKNKNQPKSQPTDGSQFVAKVSK